MSGRPRDRRDRSLERRVWDWLRRRPPASPAVIARALGLTARSSSTCLRRLLARGSATRTGVTHAVRYSATALAPDDLRGTAPATLATLRLHTRAAPTRGFRL